MNKVEYKEDETQYTLENKLRELYEELEILKFQQDPDPLLRRNLKKEINYTEKKLRAFFRY